MKFALKMTVECHLVKCLDWINNHLPCKHFMAVFHHFPNFWDLIPETYKNNPYICLEKMFAGQVIINPIQTFDKMAFHCHFQSKLHNKGLF
jgi:hypothetical protein